METYLIETIDFKTYEKYYSSASRRNVFLSPEWLKHLSNILTNSQIVLLSIKKDTEIISVFAGFIIKKFGIKICGSPFEQWGTQSMGFLRFSNIDVDYESLILLVEKHIKKTYKCRYFELVDKNIDDSLIKNKKIKKINTETPILTINKTDDELMSSFKKHGRYYVRQALKSNLIVKEEKPTKDFFVAYYEQLCDVFAKQNLKPFYNIETVLSIYESFKESNLILCIGIYELNTNKLIATEIDFGIDDWSYEWGCASYREYQSYYPNELIRWVTMKYWRDKGCIYNDLMGLRDFKLKFNPTIYHFNRYVIGNKIIILLRNLAKRWIIFLRKKKSGGKIKLK